MSDTALSLCQSADDLMMLSVSAVVVQSYPQQDSQLFYVHIDVLLLMSAAAAGGDESVVG